jgi:hypothetical protein
MADRRLRGEGSRGEGEGWGSMASACLRPAPEARHVYSTPCHQPAPSPSGAAWAGRTVPCRPAGAWNGSSGSCSINMSLLWSLMCVPARFGSKISAAMLGQMRAETTEAAPRRRLARGNFLPIDRAGLIGVTPLNMHGEMDARSVSSMRQPANLRKHRTP